MTRQRIVVSGLGAVVGAFVALAFAAFLTGNRGLESLEAIPLDEASTLFRPAFTVTTAAFYWSVIIASVVGGLGMAVIGYVAAGEADPDAPTFPLAYLLPVGAVTAGIVGYAMVRGGLGLGGDIANGMVELSIFRAAATFLLAGIVAGGATAVTVHWLVRPTVLGLGGEAWHRSRREFLLEATRAVVVPLLAVVLIFGVAFGISRLLLAWHGTGAVVLASVLAFLVLMGGLVATERPWERGSPSE